MRILMLNYEYPPLGGGGSNACKYILKEFARKNKLPINKKAIHYWTQREIITYSLKAHGFIKNLLKEKDYYMCHAFSGIPCGAIAYLFREKMID